MRKIIIVIFCVLFSSCTKSDQNFDLKYFDLKSYLVAEENRLLIKQSSITKIISKDGVNEQRDIPTVDWRKELRSFHDCDINRKSWLTSFKIDSTVNGNILILNYKSIDNKIPVKQLTVKLENKNVVFVKATIKKDNNYYSNDQYLTYYPDSLFIIKAEQQIIFADPTQYLIQGIIKK